MPRIPITDIGLQGVVADRPAQFLAPAVWTSGRNVRMRSDGVVRFAGEKQVFGTPSVAPKWAMPVPAVGNYFWFYSDTDSMFVWDGSTHSDITKSATTYGGNDDDLWIGTLLGGIPVMTNGVDAPQYWSALDVTTLLTDLANWPAGVTCKSIKAFGPHLIALNITKSGTEFPNMVKWSHPADPGAVPVSWDETDETKDAGENELTDVFAGGLVDGVPLGNVFIVYKENSAHVLRRLRNRFVFDFDPLFPNTGILSSHCAMEVPGRGAVFLATGDDIVVHGLQRGEQQSILDNRARRFLLSDIDSDNSPRSFAVPNEREKEMWFCYPESGAVWATKALVWNYVDDTISFRDLNTVSYATPGQVEEGFTNTWDSDSNTWDSDDSSWNEGVPGAQQQSILMCLPTATELRKADSGDDFNGTDIPAHVERVELTVVGVDRQRKPVVDLQTVKLIRRLWVRATGAPFQVRVGASEEEGGSITWSSEETFTPGTDNFVDFLEPLSGRFISVRFSSDGGGEWKIAGYDLEVEPLGVF